MKKAGFAPEAIIASPFVRARQTAELICTLWPEKKPIINPTLASGVATGKMRSEVIPYLNRSSLLVVGHIPDVSHFASNIVGDPWLLEESNMEPAAIWAMNPGDLEKSWGKGSFLWRRNLADWKKV
jgi:phosphohistidine phosphatase SixA